MNKILIFIAIISVFHLSCKNTKKAAATQTETKNTMVVQGPLKIFTIDQGPCFGRCPVYNITLTNDSILHLNGTNFINYMGYHQRKLSAEEFNIIMSKYYAISYNKMADVYDAGIPDMPISNLVFYDLNGLVEKKIRNAGNAPESLNELQDAVRPFINKMGWEKDVNMENAKKDELIVQLKKGTNIKSIIEENARFGLMIKETLSADNGLYLLGYDLGKIEQDRMKGVLSNNPQVMSVSLNPALELRNR